jgi:hypothetical protein
VLVDHADSRVDGGVRRVDLERLALEKDLPRVGLVEAVEDAHERRLPGAVLAEQGVHLAPPDVEIDVVVGENAGELLRDAPELEEGLLFHG